MASLSHLSRLSLLLNRRLAHPLAVRVAGISTSKKTKDTVAVADVTTHHGKEETVGNEKNWISWGFDKDCQVEDNSLMHASFFGTITLCIITVGFIWSYLPDFKERDWAQREAFLELRRRETLGLPAIDSELIPLENIELPSDEELGDQEIII